MVVRVRFTGVPSPECRRAVRRRRSSARLREPSTSVAASYRPHRVSATLWTRDLRGNPLKKGGRGRRMAAEGGGGRIGDVHPALFRPPPPSRYALGDAS